jgi:hypothetical protein
MTVALIYGEQDSCGQISFTADIWSSANLTSYLAVTSHWLARDGSTLVLKAALIGFHCLTESHTGKNIASAIMSLIDRAGIDPRKVCDHVLNRERY